MMIKKIATIALSAKVFLTAATTVHALPVNYKMAKLNNAECLIDGKSVTLSAYNIDGYNYFKIRDLCKELDYFVEWNDIIKCVWIRTSEPYVYAEEKVVPLMESINVAVETNEIWMNGYGEPVKVCNIGGYNYFMLRDLQKVAQASMQFEESANYFSVDWNEESQTIIINKLNDGDRFGISKLLNNNQPPSPTQAPNPAPTNPTQTPVDKVADEKQSYSAEEFQNEVLRLVNIEREKVGAAPLEADPLLMEIAMLKAKEMVDLNYFSHESPNYGRATAFAKHYGYEKGVGENIQSGFTTDTPKIVVQCWLDSIKGHKEQMLEPSHKYMGFGICFDGDGNVYVQMFS